MGERCCKLKRSQVDRGKGEKKSKNQEREEGKEEDGRWGRDWEENLPMCSRTRREKGWAEKMGLFFGTRVRSCRAGAHPPAEALCAGLGLPSAPCRRQSHVHSGNKH